MKVVYERDPDVGNGYQAYRGRMEWQDGTDDFIGAHFEHLLRRIHHLFPSWDQELLFIRTDRPELQPYKLEDELVTLIKDDPEAAIKAMSHPDVRIVVGRRAEPPAPLRSCGDNIAAAFGERVLIRKKGPHGECPGCGTWAPISGGVKSACRIVCDKCHMSVPCEECGDEWLFVRVKELLYFSRDKYFLPREWNGFHPWVEFDKLESLYNEFKKQKEQF